MNILLKMDVFWGVPPRTVDLQEAEGEEEKDERMGMMMAL